jgi:hypothetical protein
MKIIDNRGKTDKNLNPTARYGWLKRQKFTLALLLVGVTAFVAGVVLQREDVIGASKRFVLSFVDETTAVSNYIEGLGADPERLRIEIKQKHYTELAEARQSALERGQITPDLKVFVPAEIRYGDKKFRVKLRLKGQWTDHVETEKWSFRVKVRDGDKLFGMQRFSLQHPLTRSYGVEPAYLEALAKHDIATVRYRFVAVTVNGRDLGIYALEEAIAKEMIENRNRSEGVVVRFSSDLHYSPFDHLPGKADLLVDSGIGDFSAAPVTPYDGSRLEKDAALSEQFLLARNMLERFRDGQLAANTVFDLPRWGYFFAVSELMGTAAMARDWKDRRFLYNPLTKLLEPVGVEGARYFPLTTITGALDVEALDGFHSLLFKDRDFFEYYIRALEEVSSPPYLDDFFQSVDDKLGEDFRILHSEWPRWMFPRQTILDNAEKIRAYLNPKQGLHAYHYSREEDRIRLEVGAIQALPLEIIDVAFSGGRLRLEERLVLPGKSVSGSVKFQVITIPISDTQKLVPGNFKDMKLRYRILGSEKLRTSEVQASRKLDASIFPGNLLQGIDNHSKFEFLDIDEASKIITIKPGLWTLEESLILPRGYEIRALGVQNNRD